MNNASPIAAPIALARKYLAALEGAMLAGNLSGARLVERHARSKALRARDTGNKAGAVALLATAQAAGACAAALEFPTDATTERAAAKVAKARTLA